MKSFPTLKSDRLTLRQLDISDDQQIFLLRSDDAINQFLDRQKANTIKDAQIFIKKIIESQAQYWAINLANENQTIGTICLFNHTNDHKSCEIGFELLKQFQGHGYMQESLQLVVNYAFTIEGIQKIYATVHKNNLHSIKLLEKLSFKASNITNKINTPYLEYYFLY